MSFMFRPFPYVDRKAVNHVDLPETVKESILHGTEKIAKALAQSIAREKSRVGLDIYPGAPVHVLIDAIRRENADIRFIDTASLYEDAGEIDKKLLPYLPEDREEDPVLLYGKRFDLGYAGIMDAQKVEALKTMLRDAAGPVVVFGAGALCDALRPYYDRHIWMDITPRTAAIRFRTGKHMNVGADAGTQLPFALMMRRNYYVDFELAADLRWDLIRQNAIDAYITADEEENMCMMPFSSLQALFSAINEKPFRCRPVYLEGVWGGYYIYRLRGLPKEMKNCAWVFDLIPMEVSLAADVDGAEVEVPFFTYIQLMGEKLLGAQAFRDFHGYFPIRFNYDDTFHASGNMSIQCHPTEDYVVPRHNELGRQDESYYICVASNGAKTYLGFEGEDSCEVFFQMARQAEKTGELIDYSRYIHAVDSRPGTQLMIPAGTVHASGRNQVILEVGSLTVGSYTYKLYDYQRVDPATGERRPIHLKMGARVIRPERTADWVNENLVNHGGPAREGDGWKEVIVGEHPLLYFSLRNLIFEKEISDDTQGLFHVLALTDGEKVRIESARDPGLYFDLGYLDIAVVPAYFGAYTVKNLGVGTVTVHKTLLKKHD